MKYKAGNSICCHSDETCSLLSFPQQRGIETKETSVFSDGICREKRLSNLCAQLTAQRKFHSAALCNMLLNRSEANSIRLCFSTWNLESRRHFFYFYLSKYKFADTRQVMKMAVDGIHVSTDKIPNRAA